MAFIVNKLGEKINVNVTSDYIAEKCTLYSDNARLKQVYILNLYKNDTIFDHNKELELIKQVIYNDQPPTLNQIMYEMSRNGLSRFDIVTIESGYTLDFTSED